MRGLLRIIYTLPYTEWPYTEGLTLRALGLFHTEDF